MGQFLRVMAVGLPAGEAHALIYGLLPAPLDEVRMLGSFAQLSDFLAVGPDLKVDLLLWAGAPADPAAAGRALQPLQRSRPRCGVLLLADDADRAAVGVLTADLLERRRRGEIPPALAAVRRDLGPVLQRLLAELGWPAAGPSEPFRGRGPELERAVLFDRPVPGAVAASGPATSASVEPGRNGTQYNLAHLLQDTTAADQPTAPAETNRDKGAGAQIVVCFGPKGGVGKTTVAVSLAALAARARPGQAVLVDLDLTAADAAVHLGHFTGPDVVDLLPQLCNEPRGDTLAFHRVRGLDLQLAAAPQRPELAELVRPQHVEHLLAWLQRSGMVVIVDTPAGFGDEIVFQALAAADHLVLVTTADPASLRQLSLALEFMDRLQVAQTARRWLVLNQASTQSPVPTSRIESFLGHPVSVEIPLDRIACERAVAAGRPLVAEEPSHPISRAVGRLGSHFGWLQGELGLRGPSSWMAKTFGRIAGQRQEAAGKTSR